MNVQEALQEQPPEVEALVDALVGGELAAYLLDSATANDLIKEIAAETGLPRAAVRIAFKLLAPLIVKKAEATAGWFGQRVLAQAASLLARAPGYDKIATWLLALRSKLDQDLARRSRLDAILRRELTSTELAPEDLKGLPLDARAAFEALAAITELRADLEAELAKLSWQPALSTKILELDETTRLQFGARRVPFVGRDAELARLREFLASPARFSWWLVTGSGGQGKSRLALELCVESWPTWRAGFLEALPDVGFWNAWQPEAPTLMVIDYVSTKAGDAHRLLTTLRTRNNSGNLDAPVRVLLLERHVDDIWWKKLIPPGSSGTELKQAAFAPDPIDLGVISDDGLWRVITAVLDLRKVPHPDRQTTLTDIKRIDPQGRPLFAAMSADALAEHRSLSGWSKDILLSDVLEREIERHWEPTGVNAGYRNLACLATMTGGLPVTLLASPIDGIELPSIEEFEPERYVAMTGTMAAATDEEGNPYLAPLQPDIFGEFFVLQHVKPPHRGTNQPAERFRQSAWGLPWWHALGFAAFLDRAKDDFFDHRTLPLLLAQASETDYQRHFWATLAVNLISAYGDVGQTADARALLDLLRKLATDHPDEPEVRLRLAQGAVNLINVFGKNKRFEKASEVFDLIGQLASQHQDEEEMQFALIKGTLNFMEASKDLDEAAILVDRLQKLAHQYHDKPAFGVLLARASVLLIIGLVGAVRLDEAASRLNLLQKLMDEHVDEAEIRMRLTQGAFVVMHALTKAVRLDEACVLLDLLNRLSAEYPGEAEISLPPDTPNLVEIFGNAQRVEQARAMFALLCNIAAQHMGQSETRLRLAKAAVNLIKIFGAAQRPDEAGELFDRIRRLMEDYPDGAESCFILASCAVNAIDAFGMAGRLDEAVKLFDLLRQLAARYPDEIRVEVAKGAFNLVNDFIRAGRLTDARAVARCARDALMSPEFETFFRNEFGEEMAIAGLALLGSLLSD